MGNKHSCCHFPGSRRNLKRFEDTYKPAETNFELKNHASERDIQHISEREPEDVDGDPSNHPLHKTVFWAKSKTDISLNNRRRSQYDNHTNEYGRLSKKFSSCSTIFLDESTVSQPNLKNTIKAVALAIYFLIKNRDGTQELVIDPALLDIFDEKLHPLSRDSVPNDYNTRNPEHKSIYRFIRNLFTAAQLTAECAIVTLVYLERLLTYAEIEVTPAYWRRMVLGAIILASKVWDDQAVWTVDYCQILKDIQVDDMNELERQFLELLQFNVNVPSSVYAKYYFDLRAMADAHDLGYPFEPLSKDKAIKLEAMSNLRKDKLRDAGLSILRRSHSLDRHTSLQRGSKAILS